jgi:hypothetical protein
LNCAGGNRWIGFRAGHTFKHVGWAPQCKAQMILVSSLAQAPQ